MQQLVPKAAVDGTRDEAKRDKARCAHPLSRLICDRCVATGGEEARDEDDEPRVLSKQTVTVES